MHKPSYASLIREHREVVRRMELGSQGAIFLEADDEHARPHVPKLKPAKKAHEDDMPEEFKCRGCGDEMTAESFEVFDELCRSCDYERQAENAADARRDD